MVHVSNIRQYLSRENLDMLTVRNDAILVGL